MGLGGVFFPPKVQKFDYRHSWDLFSKRINPNLTVNVIPNRFFKRALQAYKIRVDVATGNLVSLFEWVIYGFFFISTKFVSEQVSVKSVFQSVLFFLYKAMYYYELRFFRHQNETKGLYKHVLCFAMLCFRHTGCERLFSDDGF